MGSDFLALSALADELNAALKGARTDKIVQPETDEIRLYLRAGGRSRCLVASCNAGAPRIHLTETRKKNPVTAPNFCMLLRKYLAVSMIEEVGMWSDDRIVFVRFTARTEMKDSGLPGTSRYITTKNRKNTTERLELKKYNPILRRVTVHKEIK